MSPLLGWLRMLWDRGALGPLLHVLYLADKNGGEKIIFYPQHGLSTPKVIRHKRMCTSLSNTSVKPNIVFGEILILLNSKEYRIEERSQY